MSRTPMPCAQRGPLSPRPLCHCQLCRDKGRLKRLLHRDRRMARGLKPYHPHSLRPLTGTQRLHRQMHQVKTWRCPCDPWQVQIEPVCRACYQAPPWAVAT